MVKLKDAFSPVRSGRTPKGSAGYDNPRENIDPHVRTKAVSSKEITLSDGSAAGFVKNDADGVLSGGNAGSAGSGDEVTSDAVLTDVTIVQGDGGARKVKTSTATVSQIADNVTHAAGDGSDHADVATNSAARHAAVTLNASATTGGMSLSTQEIANRAASNAQTGYATAAHITAIEANTTHAGDSTQAHSDYLLNSGTDIAVGPITITADNSTADQAYVPMILYNTDATPPAASGFPIGTVYIQYSA